MSGAAALAKLTVFAAAPVVTRVEGLLFVACFLARDAKLHARQCRPARFGDFGITFDAMCCALTAWHAASHLADRVLNGRINLILHRAIT